MKDSGQRFPAVLCTAVLLGLITISMINGVEAQIAEDQKLVHGIGGSERINSGTALNANCNVPNVACNFANSFCDPSTNKCRCNSASIQSGNQCLAIIGTYCGRSEPWTVKCIANAACKKTSGLAISTCECNSGYVMDELTASLCVKGSATSYGNGSKLPVFFAILCTILFLK